MTGSAEVPGGMRTSRLLINVAPEPTHLRRARERLRDYLDQQCADQGLVDHLVLAVDEACTNALRHSGTDRDLEISVDFEAGDLVVEVRDHGRGFDTASFDPRRVPDPLAHDGRGLYLIDNLVDELTLSSEDGVRVRMVARAVRRADTDADKASWQLRRRTVIEEMDEAFAAIDWEYRIAYCNPAALSLYGKGLEELLGRTIWELFPAADGLPVGQAIRGAMQLGISSIEEVESPTLRRWVECRIYPTSSGVSLFVRDISERKRIELERRQAEEVLRERAAEKAAQAERDRLARDLHDSVTQTLFASTMKAEALKTIDDPEEMRLRLDELEHLNRGALAQMRTLLLELRGERLEDVPLRTLFRHLIESTRGRANAAVHDTIRGDAPLPAAVHVALYRITQEALNNVVRHSGAQNAWVVLDLGPSRADLTIKDDGRGFDPDETSPTQLGLRSMRERAAEAGARFELITAVGGGTTVRVDWRAGSGKEMAGEEGLEPSIP